MENLQKKFEDKTISWKKLFFSKSSISKQLIELTETNNHIYPSLSWVVCVSLIQTIVRICWESGSPIAAMLWLIVVALLWSIFLMAKSFPMSSHFFFKLRWSSNGLVGSKGLGIIKDIFVARSFPVVQNSFSSFGEFFWVSFSIISQLWLTWLHWLILSAWILHLKILIGALTHAYACSQQLIRWYICPENCGHGANDILGASKSSEKEARLYSSSRFAWLWIRINNSHSRFFIKRAGPGQEVYFVTKYYFMKFPIFAFATNFFWLRGQASLCINHFNQMLSIKPSQRQWKRVYWNQQFDGCLSCAKIRSG